MKTVVKLNPLRFFKSITNLTVIIKPVQTVIKFEPGKTLENNVYLPVTVYNNSYNNNFIVKLINIITKWFKKSN